MWPCTAFVMRLHEVMTGMEERQWIQQILPLYWAVVIFAIKWKACKFSCVVLQKQEQRGQVKANQNQTQTPQISQKDSFSHWWEESWAP